MSIHMEEFNHARSIAEKNSQVISDKTENNQITSMIEIEN